MALVSIDVTGSFVEPDGGIPDGIVTLTLDVPASVPAEDKVILATPVRATIDESGNIAMTVYASDQGNPSGNTYWVEIDLDGRDPYKFRAVIPSDAAGGTIDLSEFVAVNPKPYYDLVGETGPTGPAGPAGAAGADGADGAPGADGADGASAYEVAVANGFVGNEAAWLASLVGADGADGAPGADGADGEGVPVGGTTGQVLAKASNTDFDTEWVDQTGGGGGTDDQTAAEVPFTPAGNIAATNVQAAIQELDSEKAATGHNHDAAYAALGHNHDAAYAAIGHNHNADYEPIGEAAAEVAAHEGAGDPHPQYVTSSELSTTLVSYSQTSHVHGADEVTYDNTTSGLTATDVQAAVDELEDELATHTHVITVEVPVPVGVYTVLGELTTGAGTVKLPLPFAGDVVGVMAAVSTAPTGASILVDVNINGTTIFTTQANRPSIAASGTVSSLATPDVAAADFTAGQYLTVDIDQIGSTLPGEDLVVTILAIEAAS